MIKAFFWKLLERFGVQGSSFILQIFLARLLTPEHYGALSIMAIFTTLANVFIHSGFNTALIQNKDTKEEDYSSVFWVSLGVACVLYVLLFFGAPLIAQFYDMPEIVLPFRALALVLFPGALNSVQIAKVSRELDFKQIFKSNVIAIIMSGIIGIVLAYYGAGLWALVIQNIVNVCLATVIMLFTVPIKFRLHINFSRIKILFAFGWKLLASNLLENIYADLRTMVVGKKFSSGVLGFYNRGKQFPQFIINATNDTAKSVMLPIMARQQNNGDGIKGITRKSVIVSSYIVFPIMFGLAGVATPLVSLLLTDKWLPCVAFLQIHCFAFSINPISSCNLQAINAIGRSDIFLKLEIIKRILGTVSIVVAVVLFDTPLALAYTSLIMGAVVLFLNAFPNKKLIGYSYFEQIKDILPSLLAALVMFVAVLVVGKLSLGNVLTLVVQVAVGVTVYVAISAILKLKPFLICLDMVKKFIKKA